MYNNQKYLIVLLWGTSIYTFQKFMENPSDRLHIILTIAISYLIYTANQIFMTDKFYNHKYLRHAIPMLIMNCILIPLNIMYGLVNDYEFSRPDFIGYFLFNLVVLTLYILQHIYYKKQINRQLESKVSKLDS